VARVGRLVEKFPETIFRVVVDEESTADELEEEFRGLGKRLRVLVDLNVGMGRTGIEPGEAADRLYRKIAGSRWLIPDGLHAYDGHQRQADLEERKRAVAGGMVPVLAMRKRLEAEGLPVPRLVLGGTPSFPCHSESREPGVECSPGTCVLHDASYASLFPDLPFEPAAVLLGRVISRPGQGRLCLDLGHKAVAADPAGDRLKLLTVPGAKLGPQSEEHLVVETPHAAEMPPGTPVLAIPTHICPTCALHAKAYVVEGGKVVASWKVEARERFLSI
jgi:D-serine deaminase-like pyridoxal phosphate-dependent protein